MLYLRWTPTPYRKNAYDEIADVPNGLGRYRIKRVNRKFTVEHNGRLVAADLASADLARVRAEQGAALLMGGKAHGMTGRQMDRALQDIAQQKGCKV